MLVASAGWGLVIGGILLAAIALELVPEADAGATLTASGLRAGTLVYVGADAWLNREPGMRAMQRSGHVCRHAAPRT